MKTLFIVSSANQGWCQIIKKVLTEKVKTEFYFDSFFPEPSVQKATSIGDIASAAKESASLLFKELEKADSITAEKRVAIIIEEGVSLHDDPQNDPTLNYAIALINDSGDEEGLITRRVGPLDKKISSLVLDEQAPMTVPNAFKAVYGQPEDLYEQVIGRPINTLLEEMLTELLAA